VIQLHPVHGDLAKFRRVWTKEFERLRTGELSGVPSRYRSEQYRQHCISFAFYSLLLDGDEGECRRLLVEAARSAENALHAPRSAAGHPLVAKEIQVDIEPGTLKTSLDSTAPPNVGYGEARMSVRDYSAGLMTLWCFGSSVALRRAAEIPEGDYRSPGIVMDDGGWQSIRTYKDLAVGREAEGLAGFRVFEAQLNVALKRILDALSNLLEGTERSFRSALVALLVDHEQRVSKAPADMSGLVCMPGMMLCRVALRRGIVVEDQNYLPLRFMPGHPANPAAVA